MQRTMPMPARSVWIAMLVGGSLAMNARTAQTQTNTDAAAGAVIEKYISALGGREAMARNKTFDMQMEREQFGTVTRTYRIEDIATHRFYQRADSPDGLQELGFDGTRVWQKRAAFHGYLGDDEVQTKTIKNPEPDIRDYRTSGRTYAKLPNETLDGTEYEVVSGIQRQVMGGEVPVKFYFDAATHLLRRRSYGNVVQVVQTFEDYRPVDGVLVPFKRTLSQPQGTTINRVIQQRNNIPVADSMFQYRENGPPLSPSVNQEGRPSSSNVAPAPGAALVLPESVRLATFESVWSKVRDTYWDSTFNGVDWNAVHQRYRPLALETKESKAFHALLSRMVGELHVSHFHVRGPESVVNEQTTTSDFARRPNAQPRIGVAIAEGKLLVEEVDSAGPAAAAGIRPGYIIERIDGRTPDAIYASWRAENTDFELPRLGRVYAAEDALRGPADKAVSLDLIDASGQAIHREVARVQQPLGLGQRFLFESKRFGGNIGYIKWSVFFNDAVTRFRGALDSLRESTGLIIDLRGNPGGVGAMSRSIAQTLFRDSASLGVSRFRHETQRYAFAGSGAAAYQGKVVILIDGRSGSTSEVFAAGLQDLGRAIVVGDTSAGAVLPSNAELLLTGGNFQHPVSNFHSPKGTELEGRGVVPDIVVKPTRESLLSGSDPVLARALAYLKTGH